MGGHGKLGRGGNSYMCGRYTLHSIELVNLKFKKKLNKEYNISPGQKVPIIDNKFRIVNMNWGIKPYWKKMPLINARSETLNERKTFMDLDRCVFIADGYFEWKKENNVKTPYYHYLTDKLIYFAGIFNKQGCCIVTKKSCKYLSKIHDRQPLMLKEEQIRMWINKDNRKILYDEVLSFHQVSNSVNNVWNNSLELIGNVG